MWVRPSAQRSAGCRPHPVKLERNAYHSKAHAEAGPLTGNFDSHALVNEHRTDRSFSQSVGCGLRGPREAAVSLEVQIMVRAQ